MKTSSALCVLAFFAAVGHAPLADAAIITTIYHGTVSDRAAPFPLHYDHTDVFGLFGPVGASLVGAPVTATFTINDATGGGFYGPDQIGGAYLNDPISAVVNVNNVSLDLSTPAYFGMQTFTFTGGLETYQSLASANAPALYDIHAVVAGPISPIPQDIHDTMSYTCQDPSCIGQGLLKFYNDKVFPTVLSDVPIDFYSVSSNSVGTPTPYPPPGPGGVPEPATWLYLIVGTGLTGLVLRARRAGSKARPCDQAGVAFAREARGRV